MKSKKIIFGVFTLISLSYIIACGNGDQAATVENTQTGISTDVGGVPVEAIIVKSQDVKKSVSLSGMLKPSHSVDIVAEVSGKIVKIGKELGDPVDRTDILAVIDDKIPLSNYRQAKSQVLSAENNLKIAELNLLSDEDLYQSGDISKLEYENSQLTVKTAEANHLSALANLSLMEKAFNDTRVNSPINGLISRKYIDLGTMVMPNDPLYRVVDISALKMEIGISQEQISDILTNTKANVEVSALDGKTVTGQVQFISPQADENTGAFTVEIHIKNTPDNLIKAGMTARVEIILNSLEDQLVVPDYAIISNNDNNFIYTVSGNKALLTPVKTGDKYQNLVAIEDGISRGDTIVTMGLKNIKDGSTVWIESFK